MDWSSARDSERATARRVGSWLAVLALAILVGAALVGPTAAQQGTVSTDGNATVPDGVVESDTPDPESDRLGWENGVWYNDTLDVTTYDGISDVELRAVVARTMARVEHIRGVEFERTPPVRLISPDRQEDIAAELTNLTATEAKSLNVGYESLLLIGESSDAVESQEALVAGGVSGYYDPSTRNVTLVSPSDDSLELQENVLSQELFHALQDNQFELSDSFPTIEARNAENSVVEGDANYVQYLYEQRCDGAWEGTCYLTENTGGASLSPNLNLGMVQLFLQPYNSGLDFVRDRYRARGWGAVDELYERLPASTEQTIHPDAYPDDEPTNLTIPDRSSDDWRPLTRDGERVYSRVGEAGWYVALVYPALETRGGTQIIPLQSHVNVDPTTGQLQRPVAYNYSHPLSTGWDGDRMVPYVSNETASNETAYVFKTAWDSPAEAREFAGAYRELLSYHDAQSVEGRVDTYTIPADSDFADAFYVARNGTRVTIVNAPTVEHLSAVWPAAAPQSDGDTDGTATPTPTEASQTATDDGESAGQVTTTPTETPGASGPGFGAVVALVALLALAAIARRGRG